MSSEIALDTSVAVCFLNGGVTIIERGLALPEIILLSIYEGMRYPARPPDRRMPLVLS